MPACSRSSHSCSNVPAKSLPARNFSSDSGPATSSSTSITALPSSTKQPTLQLFFELELKTGMLHKNGIRIRLRQQPLQESRCSSGLVSEFKSQVSMHVGSCLISKSWTELTPQLSR